nr:CBO0543 family protein [Pontibacillus sp. HMF3514]
MRWSEKKSRNRLLYSGFFMIIISSFLDIVGVRLGLWYYNYEIIPLSPAFLPWDFTVIPVSVMALIEYKHHFSPVLKALIFAFLSSFIGETIFEYFDYYVKGPLECFLFFSYLLYYLPDCNLD